jgi:hypothetical protein
MLDRIQKAAVRGAVAIGCMAAMVGVAHAAIVNLGTWTAESYPAVTGFGAGVWTVAPGGGSVRQSVNGQPTFFYSDFNAQGTTAKGTIRVDSGSGDDDFIGFALGFNPGDSSNATANYLLIDWKRGTQFFDFGSPSGSGGGTATAGLAVSRVTGTPDADEFWQHRNLAGTPAGSGLSELARAATLGATGWGEATDYEFEFQFGPSNLVVLVNGVEQFNLAGSFGDGRLAFYNFSQASVVYSAFEVDPGPFPTPEPGSGVLLGLGLAALAIGRHRRA